MTDATDTRRRTAGPPALARLLRRHALLLALGLLFLFNVFVTPNFLHRQTLFVNISQVATIAIVAVGMTLVIATRGIDLSVGAVMALAGALAPLIFMSDWGRANPGLGVAAGIAVPLMVAALCGLFNGSLVAFLGVQPIIATLILFISGRGIALVLTNGNLQTFSEPAFAFLGRGRILGLPFQGWLAVAIALVFALLVARTIWGRYLLATGGNERAAELAGVPVPRGQDLRLHDLRHPCGPRGPHLRRDQLGLGRRAQRQPDGARRHRRRRRRRRAPLGRARTHHRRGDRRRVHPARQIHAPRQRPR
jgi:predicted ABC-type sugar transport system permease subunit